ncbi:hypothetical protein D3C72_2135670 [compost metagenome]
MCQHLARIQRRIVHHGAAGTEDGEETDDVLRHVGEEQADVHARLDAQALQAIGGVVDQIAQLAIAELAPEEVYRGAFRPMPRGIVEHVEHADPGQFGVPADTGGEGFDPGSIGHAGNLVLQLLL